MMGIFYDKIKDLVKKDAIAEALDSLLLYLDRKNVKLYDETLLHKASFVQNERNNRQGLTRIDDVNLIRARIRAACLDIINELEKDEKDSEAILNQHKASNNGELPVDKLKILFLGANPLNTTRIRVDEELREIQAALESSINSGKFTLVTRWAITAETLQKAILSERPDIIHFSGHGSEGGIVLEDDQGRAKIMDSAALNELFALFSGNIKCVLLNACFSESQASEIAKSISCVIGMNDAIPDKAALKFAIGFYTGIAAGEDMSFSYKLGVNLIKMVGVSGGDIPQIKIKK